MLEFQEDFYAILGVEETASPEDIRKAYLKLAKKLHPDRFPNDPEKRALSQAEFSKVTRAHEVLGDLKQREEYDALRTLAKSRLALETSTPQASPANATATSSQVKPDQTRESWASKHYARADECFQRKRLQEAETAIKEAIRLVPNKVSYHNKLAEIYMARGWFTLALMEIQTSLRLDPKDPEAKQIEIKLKAKKAGGSPEKVSKTKKGFLEQIKEMLGKKA